MPGSREQESRGVADSTGKHALKRNAMGNSREGQEKRVQKWSSDMQRVVQPEERIREARERTRVEQEDSNSQRRGAWWKLRELSSPCLSSLLSGVSGGCTSTVVTIVAATIVSATTLAVTTVNPLTDWTTLTT